MNGHVSSAPLCFLSMVFAGCEDITSSHEEADVRACFGNYRTAILAEEGQEALRFVDRRTLDYYGRILDIALRGNRETVAGLSTINKLMVLILRHRIPLDSLKEMTAESLFIHAAEHGWVGKNDVIANELGKVVVFGTYALAVHISVGQESPFQYRFEKEDGRWKLDLTSIMPVVDQCFKQVIRESGLPEDEYLFSLIESDSGRKVSDTIWDPIVK